MSAPFDVVIAGNLLIDDLVFADGHTLMGEPGGAALYATLAASLWGVRVAVMSVAGSDYPASALATLAARGVDLAGLRRTTTPSLRTWLLYEKAGRQVIHQLGHPTHVEVSPRPEDWPASWGAPRVFHVAPMPFATQAEWTRHLARSRSGSGATFVSLDPYQPFHEGNLDAWREALADVDALFVSEDDLLPPLSESDPARLCARLFAGRLETVAFKRGPRGGRLFERRAGAAHEWTAHADTVVDSTGAGDAFAGGYLAAIAAGKSRDVGIEQGVVAASFALEAWGARGLLAADARRAEERRQAWFGARSDA